MSDERITCPLCGERMFVTNYGNHKCPVNEEVKRPLTFNTLRKANRLRQKEWPGNENITSEFRAIELAGEVGEALNCFKKLLRARKNIAGNREALLKLVSDFADELGDVQVTLDLFAEAEGIDLANATRNKFNRTSAKNGLKTELE